MKKHDYFELKATLLVAVGATIMAVAVGLLIVTIKNDPIAYMVQNDSGCDDIVRVHTGELVCEVVIESEDDAIFIVKEQGSYDDYTRGKNER